MRLFLLVLSPLVILLQFSFAQADRTGITTGGGGGGGVEVGTSIALLDLYNDGIQDSVALAPANTLLDQAFWTDLVVNGGLSRFDAPIATELVKKIEQIEPYDPYFAAGLVGALKLITWNFIDGDLLLTEDLAQSASITGAPVLALAVRQGQTVSISRPRWMKLSPSNQVALLLHETVAALAPVGTPADVIRRTVAKLFGTAFFIKENSDLRQQALQYFPSVTTTAAFFNARRLPNTFLYTRVSFGPDSDPIAFWEHPSLGLSSDFLFSPILTLELRQKHSLFRLALGQQHPFQDSDWYFARPNFQLASDCQTPNADSQLLTVNLDAYTLIVTAAPIQDGVAEPSFAWTIGRKNMASVHFEPTQSKSWASCTPHEKAQLQLLEQAETYIRAY